MLLPSASVQDLIAKSGDLAHRCGQRRDPHRVEAEPVLERLREPSVAAPLQVGRVRLDDPIGVGFQTRRNGIQHVALALRGEQAHRARSALGVLHPLPSAGDGIRR